jgi:WD repeat-containing protein 45
VSPFFVIRYMNIQIITLRNRQSTFSPLAPFLPLPKYFGSEWSYAQYRIPTQSSHISLSSVHARSPTADVSEEERCVVGWVEIPREHEGSDRAESTEYQIIALTYRGGWYRVSVPGLSTNIPIAQQSGKPVRSRTSSGSSKEKEREKESRECVLEEFRRFGRWDGW